LVNSMGLSDFEYGSTCCGPFCFNKVF